MNRKPISIQILLVATALILPSAASCTGTDTATASPLPNAVVLPFKIEPLPLQGAPGHSREDFTTLLAGQAATTAAREIIREHLAAAIERAPSNEVPKGHLGLRGTVRLPVSLPPDLRGLRADARRGPLATAVVVLVDADGKSLQEAKAELNWREVRWLKGPFRLRQSRPAEAVLIDAVDEVVKRAVRRLAKGHEGRPG